MLAALSLCMANSMANNAAFRGMMASGARMSMLNNMNYDNMDLARLSAIDTQLENDMFVSSMQYKCAMKMAEQFKELQKDNIKRSFSTFA